MAKIKELSKYKGVTINDVIMCSLTTTMKKIFAEKGQHIDRIKLSLPANLRFKFYKSRYHLKMENKFAAIALPVLLSDTMEQAYRRINQTTKSLRGSLGYVYANYASIMYLNMFTPRALLKNTTIQTAGRFTIAFSNVAGALKPFKYECKKTGTITEVVSSRSYMILPGNLGMGLNVFSQCGKVYMAFTSDDTCCDREMN